MNKIKFKHKNYELINNFINKECKIILISDFHCQNGDLKEEKKTYILEHINQQKPDFICIPGDILDDSKISIEDTHKILDFLNAMIKNGGGQSTKIITSLGNHDIMAKSEDSKKWNKKWNRYINNEWFKNISKINNLILLNDDYYYNEEFNIAFNGYTYPVSYFEEERENKEKMIEILKQIHKELDCKKILLDDVNEYDGAYKIGLIHSPTNLYDEEVLDETKLAMRNDLILSGHMHGGVVPTFIERFFGNHGLISPVKKLYPNYVRGTINRDNYGLTGIITTGVTKFNIPLVDKVLKPEIVDIKIKTR